jgi:S-adenosylmethionine:tRNA ribosyltransferase-isomerase
VGLRHTGAYGEVLLLRPVDGGEGRRWEALVRPGGKLKPGRTLVVHDELRVEIEEGTASGGRIVRLVSEGDPRELVERHGRMPIPPYLDRPSVPLDRERYQTVYAEEDGSVAAPTAGLHFTRPLLERLEAKGVRLVRITLHVGVGTFRPVDAERPEDHELHEETFRVGEDAAAALNEVRGEGGSVWAVGTTATRTLETVVDEAGRFRADRGRTDLFIHPPYRFRAVDRLVTNFHLPRSSLLMLVSAFAGHERTLAAYRHAVDAGYRFYSYGDAMAVI